MSSGNSAIDSDFAVAYQASLVEDYCYVAGAALLLYDTAITFGQEVELVWKRKRSGVTVLFMTNRVLTLMLAVSMILFVPNFSQMTTFVLCCMGTMIYGMVPQLLLFFVWASFSALRVYAIGGHAWRTATVVFFLSLAPFITNLYIDTKYLFSLYPLAFICVTTPNIPTNILIIMEIVARVSTIVADAIVLAVTWKHTYSIRKHANAVNMKTSLATLLVRDGTLFFLIGLALNAAQLGNYLRLITGSGTDISYWVTAFSCIITSRFLLSLRQLYEHQLNQTEFASSRSATLPSFATSGTTLDLAPGIVADMGAEIDISLLYASAYEDEPEEWEEEMKVFEPLAARNAPVQDVPLAVIEEVERA